MKKAQIQSALETCHSVIVCALACEAKPLLEALKFHYGDLSVVDCSVDCDSQEKTKKQPYKLYLSSLRPYALLVTGVGQENCAQAIAWANGFMPNAKVWVNFGVAGHVSAELGSLYVVNSVRRIELSECSEKRVQKVNYPMMHFRRVLGEKLRSESLITVDKPVSNYDSVSESESLFDMEGASFYEACRGITNSESIQLLKVVSDNNENHHQRLSAAEVTSLMSGHIDLVFDFVELLGAYVLPHIATQEVDAIVKGLREKMHITESQKQQLLKLLPLAGNKIQLDDYASAKQLINCMNQYLLMTPPNLSKPVSKEG